MTMKTAVDLTNTKKRGDALLFPKNPRINVSTASCGLAKGAESTLQALRDVVTKKKFDATVVACGCNGLCYKEPTVEVSLPGRPKIIYGPVSEKNVQKILDASAKDSIMEELAITRIDTEEHILRGTLTYATEPIPDSYKSVKPFQDHDYFCSQQKVLLRNAGSINPESLDEYVARGGYEALSKALKMKPKDIVDEIAKSGLRGRGGGGFPVGLKWKNCIETKAEEKYLICNISEGEPGIGMHRSFLESDPHSVLEGLIIGAHALGVREGYVYIRDNYRLALERFRKAVADATEAGLLGKNILGSSLNFTVTIKEGGGRFVSGEETSLIACIEGRIGEPRQRPPFPTQSGLWGKPTCINNVETWANVPVIIMKGSRWYSSIGTQNTKGTKVISLAGDIARAGMIEVAMGTSLNQLINDIGGGVANGKKLKAVQTGGPSGGVLPAKMTNMVLDYDTLKSAGSLLGSGGIIVMDEDKDMVEVARYFTNFFAQESCGKCVPCREGIYRMSGILDEILEGRGSKEDLIFFETMALPITESSACALGKTAPMPILSTIKHFRQDYLNRAKKETS
jgi:NADH:ubiquinone oxidoreductase subunit F (NADH-binding)/(2Fe-2S) ferredoxin